MMSGTIFFRASKSEFIIPLAKYVKAVYHTRVSVGLRFRMLFETEESSIRRYTSALTFAFLLFIMLYIQNEVYTSSIFFKCVSDGFQLHGHNYRHK